MNPLRRDFLKQSSFLTGSLFLYKPFRAFESLSKNSQQLNRLLNQVTIIHTNDLHNNIDALTTGKKNGYGGLKNIENCLGPVSLSALLLDGGDFLDESLSLAEHKKMISYMNHLGYRAATLGNRELSKGQDYLAALLPFMKFSIVNCNYSFTHPHLMNQIHSYSIIRSGKYRIGLTGVGVNPDQSKEKTGITWHHPYDKASSIATYLKNQKNCDLVICLSHLGHLQTGGLPHNVEFAKASEQIDLIIGGHDNIILPNLLSLKNNKKEEVMVSQGGQGGILLRQINFTFNNLHQKSRVAYRNYIPGSKSGSSAFTEIKEITT